MRLAGMSAYLANEMGEIPGKKAFQKLFYFLTVAGVPTGLNYEIYHYGPYSSQLDYAMDNLENLGAIDVIEDGAKYRICPGSAADTWMRESQELVTQYHDQFDLVLQKLPRSPLELELLSTTHFMADVLRSVYGDESEEKIIQEVVKVKKDKFPSGRIQQAIATLKELALI